MSFHVAVSGWLLGAHSGANRRLLQLLAHASPMLRDGERVTVLHAPSLALPQLPTAIAFAPVDVPPGPAWRRALAERRLLRPALERVAATICDHGFLPAPRTKCPLALTIHDVRDLDGEGRRARWLARTVLRRACSRAAVVVVPSAFTKARLAELAPSARIAVVGNGVELAGRQSAPNCGNGPLLHVGHLEARKNLDVLVHALAAMAPSARPELWLAGADAGSGDSLHALAARLGVQDRLRLLGVVDERSLTKLYETARAVLVPSRHEGFGLCALEGLAHGRPVLVADRGALPEVVGTAGTVLPADEPEAWAQALERLDDGEAARQRRRERAAHWSWDRAAAAQLEVWRSLA